MKPHDRSHSISRRLALAGLMLATAGCIKARMYRPENIEQHDGYRLAFIEFDDQGEPWAPSQLERTVNMIKEAQRDGKRCVVVLFVHGWQNDASKREDRKKDNNVEGFQRLLESARDQARKERGSDGDIPSLIGVYLGWRGKSTNVKPLKPLTFYSRRGAGQRVAGIATTEAIIRVMAAAKTNPSSGAIVIGHSFGGMIVEAALVQSLVGAAVDPREQIEPLADLVLLVNPASQSMVAKNMLSILERNRLQFYRVSADGKRRPSPFIVSVTSTADTATGNLYPFALGLKGTTKQFRKYGGSDCSPVASQRTLYKHTAGHNLALHSHVVTAQPMTDAELKMDHPMVLKESINPENGETRYTFPGQRDWFTIERLPLSINDTPYWIMSVPPELIASHSDIFTFDMIRLIRALLRASGATGDDERTVLVRDDGVRPIELASAPGGGIAFLELSRRFYLLRTPGSSPLELSCLPSIINPESAIGVFYHGTRAALVASGKSKDDKKPKNQTILIAFDFAITGAESQTIVEIRSDLKFEAATGDTEKRLVYLTSGNDLYVADFNRKKPKAELMGRLDGPEFYDELEMDAEGKRIFATNREAGGLYVIDLSGEAPVARLVADGLGIPLDLVLAPDRSLYVLDSTGGRVLKLNCPVGRACGPPEQFASSPRFQRPVAIEVDDDGRIWVADLDARAIFTLDPTGRVTPVLGSMGDLVE